MTFTKKIAAPANGPARDGRRGQNSSVGRVPGARGGNGLSDRLVREPHPAVYRATEPPLTIFVASTGMESLQKSAAVYVKWENRRCDASEDKSRCTPIALLGRSMTAHGNDFEPDSEFRQLPRPRRPRQRTHLDLHRLMPTKSPRAGCSTWREA